MSTMYDKYIERIQKVFLSPVDDQAAPVERIESILAEIYLEGVATGRFQEARRVPVMVGNRLTLYGLPMETIEVLVEKFMEELKNRAAKDIVK